MKLAFYCRAPYNGPLTIYEQEQRLLSYIKNNFPDFSLYAIYVDHQSQERLQQRPAYFQLIRDARKELFQLLICWNHTILSSEESFPVPVVYVSSENQ